MATTYKILGQDNPGTTSNSDMYTVPSSTSAIVSTITVSNVTATDATFRIFIQSNGAGASTANALAYDAIISANSFTAFTLGLTLSAGDVITVRSGTNSAVTFQAFGSELT